MWTPPLGPSVELPMGPRNAVLGGGDACGHPHLGHRWSSLWGHETLSWVGETHADTPTEAFGGAPYGATKRCPGWGRRMRTPPLGPSVELPMGPRNAVLGGGDACGHPHLGLRWSSLWGHETLSWVGDTHADTPTGAFGGAPYGATKRCPGWGRRMWTPPLGPSVELTMGPRNAVLGGGDACG